MSRVLCLLFFSVSLLAQPIKLDLSSQQSKISVSWKNLVLKDIQKEEGKAHEATKMGPVDVDLHRIKFKYSVSGIRIEDGMLKIDDARVEYFIGEVKGKNVIVIPQLRVRKETPLFTHHNPGIVAEKKRSMTWHLPLPEAVKVELKGNSELTFLDGKDIEASLHKAVDEKFSDAVLDELLTYRLVNVPGVIEPLIKLKIDSEKKGLFAGLRATLKEDISKPQFLQNLQRDISKQIPPLDLNGETYKGQLHLGNGTAPSPGTLSFSVNEGGMTQLLSWFLASKETNDRLGRLGSQYSAKNELLYTPENPLDQEEAAAIASALVGEEISPKDLSSLGLDIFGKRSKIGVKFLNDTQVVVTVGMSVYSRRKTDKPIQFPVELAFTIEESGQLNLAGVRSVERGKVQDTLSLLRQWGNDLRLELVRILFSKNIAQKHSFKMVNGILTVQSKE